MWTNELGQCDILTTRLVCGANYCWQNSQKLFVVVTDASCAHPACDYYRRLSAADRYVVTNAAFYWRTERNKRPAVASRGQKTLSTNRQHDQLNNLSVLTSLCAHANHFVILHYNITIMLYGNSSSCRPNNRSLYAKTTANHHRFNV